MAPPKARSLAQQLADLDDPTPKDFDPEDLERDVQSSDDEDEKKETDLNAGREHYQAVGKGKLRKQEAVELGKQYAGARVSRDALEADSDDDPFAARDDDDQSSSSSEEMSDVETSTGVGAGAGADGVSDDESNDGDSSGSVAEAELSFRPKQKQLAKKDKTSRQPQADSDSEEAGDSESDMMFDDDDESGSETGDEEEEGDLEDMEDDEDEDESEDEDDVAEASSKRSSKAPKQSATGSASNDREELRRLMASDQKTIAATISQAAKADAAKGEAVKSQRTTFDALLNTRIKLQKALGAVNEMSALTVGEEKDAEADSNEGNADAIKSAESAALTLWSTIEELRTALAEAHSKDGSKKRKRPSPVTSDTKTDMLWERMTELESESLVHRRSNLDKWSSKVRGNSSSLPNARGKLLGSASGQQTITAVLDAQVATELGDSSSKRARVSKDADSASAPEPIYDDTVFYQSLLRDLVEQRMSSSEAMTGGMDTLHQLPSRLPIHPVTGMRNDKNRREAVDTRASKGRKMRFNVHEKLQNFMAPEDRGVWTLRAREEFFASLLGRTASGLLGERDESGSDEESDNDREEGGLRLFRN